MSATPSRAARGILLGIVVATVLTAFVPRDLWSPDEQRYGHVSREILEGGDAVVLHLNGRPYAEKPPLFFWTVAGLGALGGEVTSFTTRLTGSLYAALAFVALWFVTRRWFGREDAATAAVAMFATNLMILHNGTRGTMDLAMTAFILLAVDQASQWLRGGRVVHAALFGLFVAAGALTKGPMGLLLPLFAFVGEAVGLGSRRARLGLGWAVAPAVAVGAGLAWLLPALAMGGERYQARLLGQLGTRVSGAEQTNVQGPLWLAGVFLLTTLPWVIHLLAGAWTSLTPRRRDVRARAGLLAAAGGGVLGILLLLLSATKREVYVIPYLPFFAAAAAYVLAEGRARRVLRAGTILAVGAPLAGAVLTLGLAFVGDRFLIATQPWPEALFDERRFLALLPALLFFLLGFAAAWPLRFQPLRAAGRVGLVLAVGALLLKAGLLPEIDQRKSFRTVAALANEAAGEGGSIVAGPPILEDWLWNLHRSEVARVDSLEALAQALDGTAGPAAAIAETRWWERERAGLERVAAEAGGERAAAARRLLEQLDELEIRGEARAEHRIYRVLASRR